MENKDQILELSLSRALEAYKNGDENFKKNLITLYGAKPFITDIKQRVTGYEAACEITGRTPLTIEDFEFLGSQSKRAFNRHKIATGIAAINEGWVPNWDDENEYKYYIWMYNKKRGFSSRVDVDHCTGSVGGDLYIETRDKAEVIERVFAEEYQDYLF